MHLLRQVMIRAAKSDLITIPPCHTKVGCGDATVHTCNKFPWSRVCHTCTACKVYTLIPGEGVCVEDHLMGCKRLAISKLAELSSASLQAKCFHRCVQSISCRPHLSLALAQSKRSRHASSQLTSSTAGLVP